MALSATKLRQNLYSILDEVIDTGVPVIVERKGHILRIVPENRSGRLDRLEPHPKTIQGDPEDIVHLDWSKDLRNYEKALWK